MSTKTQTKNRSPKTLTELDHDKACARLGQTKKSFRLSSYRWASVTKNAVGASNLPQKFRIDEKFKRVGNSLFVNNKSKINRTQTLASALNTHGAKKLAQLLTGSENPSLVPATTAQVLEYCDKVDAANAWHAAAWAQREKRDRKGLDRKLAAAEALLKKHGRQRQPLA
jgi:hypothetical protein